MPYLPWIYPLKWNIHFNCFSTALSTRNYDTWIRTYRPENSGTIIGISNLWIASETQISVQKLCSLKMSLKQTNLSLLIWIKILRKERIMLRKNAIMCTIFLICENYFFAQTQKHLGFQRKTILYACQRWLVKPAQPPPPQQKTKK